MNILHAFSLLEDSLHLQPLVLKSLLARGSSLISGGKKAKAINYHYVCSLEVLSTRSRREKAAELGQRSLALLFTLFYNGPNHPPPLPNTNLFSSADHWCYEARS